MVSEKAMAELRGLALQWRHNAQGCGRKDQHAAGTWRSCARELNAALAAMGATHQAEALHPMDEIGQMLFDPKADARVGGEPWLVCSQCAARVQRGVDHDPSCAGTLRYSTPPAKVPEGMRELSALATPGELFARVIERNGEVVDAFLTVPSITQGHSVAGPIPMEWLADDSYNEQGPEQKAHDARFTAAALNYVRAMLAAAQQPKEGA